MSRIILHLDMDAFFASVEQAVNPALRGRPVIVGSRRKKHYTVVAACSYEAKKFGIESGMLSTDALALCPDAVFVACDSARYMYTSDRIFNMLKGFADRLERASIDEFNLDFTRQGYGKAADTGAGIRSAIRKEFSINGSVGVAPTRVIAKIAAKSGKPDGLVVVEEPRVREFLSGMPVEKVPGIGPHLKQYLHDMCVYTLGDLAALSLERLTRRFGKVGGWMYRIVRGMDDDPVPDWRDPAPPPKSVGHSYTLEREICRRQDIEAWIRLLSEMVGHRLRAQGLEARVTHLYLRGREAIYSREKIFSEPSDDPAVICRRCLRILDSFQARGFSVRGLGVSVSRLTPSQGIRLFESDKKRRRLISAMDAINGRFGEWSVCPAAIKDIHG